ncbi:MAG: DNA translocase FtsK 4TM domain-containing protein, partial [Candidatus Sedimenticola endophacoides]
MAQASKAGEQGGGLGMHVGRRLREVALLLLLAVAVYLILSLITFSPGDPGWSFTGSRDHVTNAGGPVGAWFADVFLYLFGVLA